MKVYYNEIDKYCVQWLRNMIYEKLIVLLWRGYKMSGYRDFLCDIYEDNDLLCEKIEVSVYMAYGHSKGFSERNKFREAADSAVTKKCLPEIEDDPEKNKEFKVIVTEILTGQKRVITIEIESEETISYSCAIIKEEEYNETA